MSSPYPLQSPLDPQTPVAKKDYNYAAPLNPDGSNFPCKGYQGDTPIRTTATYRAGSNYTMTLSGSAIHIGGSCQLSLSYDNGATFKVIKSMIGGCPISKAYDFTIPSFAPIGTALFAWTWLNYEGNREFYMNCAEVEINADGPSDQSKMDALPDIWVANLQRINDCTTKEASNPVFPDPGPDVVYGGGMSTSSPATPGNCEVGSSSASSYSSVGDTSPMMMAEMPMSITTMLPAAATTYAVPYHATASAANQQALAGEMSAFMHSDMPASSAEHRVGSASFVTIIDTYSPLPTAGAFYVSDPYNGYDCEPVPDVTITITPTITWSLPWHTWPASRPSGFTTSRILPPPGAYPPPPAPPPPPSADAPSPAPPADNPPPAPTGNAPPYAIGDTSAYLPCVPGTFLCTSTSAFLTCTSSTAWSSPRDVAAGMTCLPNLTRYTNAISVSSFLGAGVPAGYYRDDRYVRARPYGSCGTNGAAMCGDASSGTQGGWLVCDQGGWIYMGLLAAGTVCTNGVIGAG